MTIDDETLESLLAALPEPRLSQTTHRRTLILARANLPAPSGTLQPPLWGRLAAGTVPAALFSADLVFFADACVKMGRGFGP